MYAKLGLVALAAGLVAACESTPANRADEEARRQLEIAARQGEEVSQICFTRNIRGWREFDEDSVLLERGLDDWYRVELSGFCQPELAFNTITLETRAGSSCLARGDEIEIPDAPLGGSCFITAIYEWDEEAVVPGEDGE